MEIMIGNPKCFPSYSDVFVKFSGAGGVHQKWNPLSREFTKNSRFEDGG